MGVIKQAILLVIWQHGGQPALQLLADTTPAFCRTLAPPKFFAASGAARGKRYAWWAFKNCMIILASNNPWQ
jgi:hypothetical protein